MPSWDYNGIKGSVTPSTTATIMPTKTLVRHNAQRTSHNNCKVCQTIDNSAVIYIRTMQRRCGRRSSIFTACTAISAIILILAILSSDVGHVSAKQSSSRRFADHLDAAAADADAEDGNAKSLSTNQITGQPEIQCGFGVVHFRVVTEQGRASSIYVRGQSANPDCVFHNANNVTIELSKCNVRRKREVKPSGVAYQMTIVVQMHPLFVTKVDRAYNVNCFYMERHQDVGTEFNVSDLSPSEIAMDAVLPNCTYSVHRDSPNGPLVRFTRVGEQLYHVWECPSSMYKMLLYNCAVVDSEGSEYSIIDERGCSRDEFLMPQISYASNVTKAMVATAAFNFPDRNKMSFSCKIRLCYTNECNSITPPQCGTAAKSSVTPNSLSQELETSEPYHSTTTMGSTDDGFTEDSTGSSTDGEDNNVVTFDETEETTTTSTSTSTWRTSSRSRTSGKRRTTSSKATTTTTMGSEETETTTTEKSTTTKPLTTSSELSSTHSIAEEDEQEDDNGTTLTTLPDDFPRPKSLNLLHSDSAQADEPIDDDGSGEGVDNDWSQQRGHAPHFVAKKLPSGTDSNQVDSIEVINKKEFVSEQSQTIFSRSTPPMVIFNKASPTKAANANAKYASEARGTGNRLARDTTLPMVRSDSSERAPRRFATVGAAPPKHVVDFDISSDELTIMDATMDDFAKPGTLEKREKKPTEDEFASLVRRDVALPLFDREPDHGSAVCFSPLALAFGGVLAALFLTTIGFVLLKATRKTVHAFH